MKKDIIQVLKVTAFALALTLGINYVMAWTGPTQSPPNGNVPAPINTGITNQVKDGGLSLNALSVLGNSIFSGNVGIGGVNNPTNKLDVKTTSTVNGISFNGAPALTGYQGNGWLRLNQSKSFPNGVYTPGTLRSDGGMRSSKYCDVNGNNCTVSSSLGGITGSRGSCYWTGLAYQNSHVKICNVGYWVAGIYFTAVTPGASDWDGAKLYCCKIQ